MFSVLFLIFGNVGPNTADTKAQLYCTAHPEQTNQRTADPHKQQLLNRIKFFNYSLLPIFNEYYYPQCLIITKNPCLRPTQQH